MADAGHSQILQLKLSSSQSPVLRVDQNRHFIKWGANNKYPSEKLLYWFENNSLHGAICRGKARYLTGTKLLCSVQGNQVDEFLQANPIYDWYELRKRSDLDRVIFGGYHILLHTNSLGTPVQFFHLEMAKCRYSDCGKFVLYSDDWSNFMITPVTIPIYVKGMVGTAVYVYKSYSPSASRISGIYPRPEYENCSQDIDTETRISVFFNSIVRNNFSVGTIITVKNGEKDPKAKKNITECLTGEYAGEENAGKPIVIFTDKDGNPTEVVHLNANDLDKQYQEICKRNQQNIISGHGVNAILFKIKTEGQLGGRTEIVEAHEQFINEYVKPEQQHFNTMLETFFKARYNLDAEFDAEQVSPIGLEIPLDNQTVVNALNAKDPNIIANYIIEKYAVKLPTDQTGKVIESAVPNDSLRGLTAGENSDVYRIIRDHGKGKIPDAMALHRLAAYGIDSIKAKEILGIEQVQMSSQADKSAKFIALFNQYAHDITDDEVIEIQAVKMAKEGLSEKAKLELAVLDQLKGNPDQSEYKLAKTLGVDKGLIDAAILDLIAAGLIASLQDFTPTEKGLKKTTNLTDTEIYTEYVYGLRADQAGTDLILPTTRDFCKQMVTLTKTKAISYESIQSLENELGESAWDFRGGFYNNGEETTNYCRHVWKAVTKVKRK